MELNGLINKCIASGNLIREEILFLLALEKEEDVNSLLRAGYEVRKNFCGDDVHIRALVEFSNICARHCNYCGLRAPNKHVKRYRLTPEEIIELACQISSKGLKTLVLQSGEDNYFTGEMIARIVRDIKSKTDMAVTLCAGERSYEDYKLWREAGADRYLLRHETANCEHYSLLHPDSYFQNRMRCLKLLRDLGYQVGAGCMVGSPFQTLEHLADDIEFIRNFQPDMIGIGPFIPHPDTPFGDKETGTIQMTLKMVALARIVTRNSLIPATTAIGSIEEMGREMALDAGADVVMPNFTPLRYREHYEIYPNKRCINEDPSHCLSCMKMRIEAIGRKVSVEHGHSRKI
jgi:biotin synthase